MNRNNKFGLIIINNGTINGDVEKMGGSFVNNGTVTGSIIE